MARCAARDVAYRSSPVAEHSPCIVIDSVEVVSSVRAVRFVARESDGEIASQVIGPKGLPRCFRSQA